MYRVLIPVDQSETRSRGQVAAATDLARETETLGAWVLHVFDDRDQANGVDPSDLTTGATVMEELEEAGARVETLTRFGDPATEILNAAENVHADQILMGGRKRSPLGSFIFGSVSQGVMREANRPVVVTGGVDADERPTHRCQSCGETYTTRPSADIGTCRSCGGTTVEAIQ